MKIVSKLKEYIERKNLIKDINRSFEELGYEIVKRDRTRNLVEKSLIIDTNLKIPESNDFLFNKSWDIDNNYDDTIERVRYPSERRKIFKNPTKELNILKKDRLQLKDVKTF